MKRGLLIIGVLLGATACGDPEPEMPTNAKTMPMLQERYQRRSLTTWRSLAGALPVEERAARMWALSVLEWDKAPSVDLLLAGLDDPAPSVRLAAVIAVGRLAPRSPRAAERLVELFSAPEEPIRRHARLAVGKLGPAAADPLRAALKAERVSVRWAAVFAFRDMGLAGRSAVEDLARLATEDPNARVRRQALFSLARLGEPGIAASVRLWRKATSVQRAELAAALALAGPAVVQPMAALLTDEDEDLAARAAGVLADFGPQALPVLEALLAALRRKGPVRFNAAEALLRMGPQALERVKPLTESADEGLAAIADYILDTAAGR